MTFNRGNVPNLVGILIITWMSQQVESFLPLLQQQQRQAMTTTTTTTKVTINTIFQQKRENIHRLYEGKEEEEKKDSSSKEKETIITSKTFAKKFEERDIKQDILDPFIPALDKNYMNIGELSTSNNFIISREGGTTNEEVSNDNLLKILTKGQCNDLDVNTLVWKCLGYRYDNKTKTWNNSKCFPKWKLKYPTPPDFINMKCIYSKEHDGPCLLANRSLVQSIPLAEKQQLRKHLKPLGFTGFKLGELTPNLTRRAQCTNWLLYYREELMGYTLDELIEKQRIRKEKEQQELLEKEQNNEDTWQPPIREAF